MPGLLVRGWKEANKGNVLGGGMHAVVTTNSYVWIEKHIPSPLGTL